MAMVTTSKKLYGVYKLDTGKDYTLSIADPKPGLDRAAVEPALQAFVTNDAIRVGTAGITSLTDAYIREIQQEDII